MECDSVQGFWLCAPVDGDAAGSLLRSGLLEEGGPFGADPRHLS
jgi:hypothetical protein